MKLNRLEMIRLCQVGIENARAEQVEWDRKVEAAERKWDRDWKDVHAPKWREFRDKLTRALNSGARVTLEDMPVADIGGYRWQENNKVFYRPFNRGSFYGHNREWRASHNFGPRPTADIGPFEVLQAFLEAVVDEVVSTGQLEAAGFRNLNKLLTMASGGALK